MSLLTKNIVYYYLLLFTVTVYRSSNSITSTYS